jgi:hypothetical protein
MGTRAPLPAMVMALTGLAVAQIAVTAQQPEQISAEWKDAGGVKAALYNWANHMGMLRGVEEHDQIATLEYFADGTLTVNGQACKLTKYHVEINYQMSGQRTDLACTLPNGQTHQAIEVVGGGYAWNEEGGPGAGLVAGQGKAVPMPDLYAERAIRLWNNPQGAVKSAIAGGANTKVGMEGGKTVVTYPVQGVTGAVATATLIAGPIEGLCTRNCAERVEVRHGGIVTEFLYSNYADYNHAEEKLDAFYAGRIVERRNGTTVREINVTRTNTPNLYIVVPVPPSVRSAGPQAK